MSPMIVHHNHFEIKLLTSIVSLVEVFYSLNISRICNQMGENIAINTDCSDYRYIFFFVLCPLHNQWQHWIFRLPNLWSCSPAICRGLIHVNNFSAVHHMLENLLNEYNFQFNHIFFASGAVEAAMNLKISYFEFFITICQSVSRHWYIVFLFQDWASCIEWKMSHSRRTFGSFKMSVICFSWFPSITVLSMIFFLSYFSGKAEIIPSLTM